MKKNFDEIKNITEQLKKSDYDQLKRNQLEALNNLDKLVGNSELELHAIQLNIEDISTQLKNYEYENTTNSNKKIQDLSKLARLKVENSEKILLELDLRVEKEIKTLKSSFKKIAKKNDELRKKEIKILEGAIDVAGYVAISRNLSEEIKTEIENFKIILNRTHENNFNLNSQNDLITKIENYSVDITNKVISVFNY